MWKDWILKDSLWWSKPINIPFRAERESTYREWVVNWKRLTIKSLGIQLTIILISSKYSELVFLSQAFWVSKDSVQGLWLNSRAPAFKPKGRGFNNRQKLSHLQDGQENFEGDAAGGSMLVHHQLLDLGLRRILSESADDVTDEGDRNSSVAAVVVEQEGLLEFSDLG